MAKNGKRMKQRNARQLSKRQKQDLKRFGEQHPVDDKEAGEVIEAAEVYDYTTPREAIDAEDSESSEEEQDTFSMLVNTLGVSKRNLVESEDEEEIEENATKPFPFLNDNQLQSSRQDEVQENEEYEESDAEDEDISTQKDTFSLHFETNIESEKVPKPGESTKESKNWPYLGNLDIISTKLTSCTLKMKKTVAAFDLKNVIVENMTKSLLLNFPDKNLTNLSGFQTELLSVMECYRDMLFTERNVANGEEVRFVYTLHALNHVLKTRSRIVHHNAKLSQNESGEYRDQGFVRPKVVIVVPFRESCLRIVKILISLLFGDKNDDEGSRVNVMNGKRFAEEFSPEDLKSSVNKPDDFKETFSGNIDDSFRIGISVTKKSLKLYSDFYSSDIIIASPLGLRIIIGAKGDKQRDYDFLSSVEVLILDQTDVYLMQNWEHVVLLMKHLNLQPTVPHGVDFSRVRMWSLEGLSRNYRQTLIFSSVACVPINAIFNGETANYEGKVVVRNPVMSGFDVVRQVVVQCPQIFNRFDCNSLKNLPEERFNYFIRKILPEFKDALKSHTMVYIPSYFDFVRLRNYFRKEELNFTHICEYTKEGKVAQSRSLFFHGGRHFLLYTERAHFFNRYRIKGIRHLIFYELPTYPHFYSELCNLLHPSHQGKKFTGDESCLSCTTIYSKYDYLSLEAVVGTERAKNLMQSFTDTHLFVTENKRL